MGFYQNIWLASCELIFISSLYGFAGVSVHVVYLCITHAVMWFVEFIEPKYSNTAAYTAAVISLLLAILAVVQYNVCEGRVLACMQAGAAFITSIACAVVDLAAVDHSLNDKAAERKKDV